MKHNLNTLCDKRRKVKVNSSHCFGSFQCILFPPENQQQQPPQKVLLPERQKR